MLKKYLPLFYALIFSIYLSAADAVTILNLTTANNPLGNWTVPAGVTSITVTAIAGGGDGLDDGDRGGCGGDSATSTISVTEGQQIPFSVGTGGDYYGLQRSFFGNWSYTLTDTTDVNGVYKFVGYDPSWSFPYFYCAENGFYLSVDPGLGQWYITLGLQTGDAYYYQLSYPLTPIVGSYEQGASGASANATVTKTATPIMAFGEMDADNCPADVGWGDILYTGGNSGSGNGTSGGGGGGAAGSTGNGTAGTAGGEFGGAGGAGGSGSPAGGAGGAGGDPDFNGVAGVFPGGGGGGGGSAQSGADGANGTIQITYTLGGDSCTPPGSGNYAITASDNCNFTTAVNIPGNMSCSGSGVVHINSTMRFNGSNQYIAINPGCSFVLDKGGSIQ